MRQSRTSAAADQLLGLVLDGTFPPGGALPSEAELAERFEVSRLTVREAIRSLASTNVIEVQQGKSSTINQPDRWSPLDPRLLQARGRVSGQPLLLPRKLIEARRTVEVGIAELAAGRRTDEHIGHLYLQIEAMRQAHQQGDVPRFVEADLAFHRTLFEAVDNVFLDAVFEPLAKVLRTAHDDVLGQPDPRARDRVARPDPDRRRRGRSGEVPGSHAGPLDPDRTGFRGLPHRRGTAHRSSGVRRRLNPAPSAALVGWFDEPVTELPPDPTLSGSKPRLGNYDLIVVLFCGLLLISNIGATKLIQFGPIITDGGAILFPLTYILGDVLSEVYGFRRAKRAILMGFGLSVLASVTFYLVQIAPAADAYTNQEAFEAVLGFVPRIVLASTIRGTNPRTASNAS